MTNLRDDEQDACVVVVETYQPLVTLGASFGPARARVRGSVAVRLRRAQLALPVGLRLQVVEGHATTPPSHATGAAVDVILVDLRGMEVDMATGNHRALLAAVLGGTGLVGDPEQWWHWSFGDHAWVQLTGAATAPFGPIRDLDAPDAARGQHTSRRAAA